MAETESSGSTGVVAIFAIVLLVMIAGFFAWRMGVFGGDGSGHTTHEFKITTPSSK